MPRKKEIIMVVDTETCGTLENAFVYDLGLAIVERTTGKILETRSLIIENVFEGLPALMQTAYYAKKLPIYHAGIVENVWEVVNLWHARAIVAKLVKQYGIKRIYAYNVRFDLNALNNTWRLFTKGKSKYFFPYGTKMCCILKMTRQTIAKKKSFKAFCIDNGFTYGKNKNIPSVSAQNVYAYITNNPEYIECHTGLEDVLIETEILTAVLKMKKKVCDYLYR